jgi:hypothetical protein
MYLKWPSGPSFFAVAGLLVKMAEASHSQIVSLMMGVEQVA